MSAATAVRAAGPRGREPRAHAPAPAPAPQRNHPPPATPPRCLASYRLKGIAREVVVLRGARGTTLVVDRERATQRDPRLLGELAREEPIANAKALVADYMRRSPAQRRCAPLTGARSHHVAAREPPQLPRQLCGPDGSWYRIAEIGAEPGACGALRWQRTLPATRGARGSVTTLRDVVGALESYGPAIAMSEHAIAANPTVDHKVLAGEIKKLRNSTLVLNRRLREAVEAALAVSMPLCEIAARCGRYRRDCAETGEGSWVARRVGIAADGGATTPWITSDTLSQIAEAIGLDPQDVEI